jgi:hypothetical protein
MTTDDVLRRLEKRVRLLEDERSIASLVARYGPLVDNGDPAAADLWIDEGVYDCDELVMEGSAAVADMVRSRPHQRFIAAGCAHVQGPVVIEIDGDDATAVGYSLMLVHDNEGYRVRRVTANRWELTRTEQGWRVKRRTNRQLDGQAEARALLTLHSPSDGC